MQHINTQRRAALRNTGVLGAALATGLFSRTALAEDWNKAAFDQKSLADVAKSLGASSPTSTTSVDWGNTPDIAENGAVVPVAVTSKLPKTERIAILIEKNPSVLSSDFSFPAGTEPYISTRVKMGQTSNVFALIKADGKWLVATKEIKVTLGGCGG